MVEEAAEEPVGWRLVALLVLLVLLWAWRLPLAQVAKLVPPLEMLRPLALELPRMRAREYAS